ncbi:putative para-nitrobenzyl esterase [Actinacidiphila reveromycinica]|uniref:Carboxylic ester hydrolase n=1 Tax=Actinacidiphila reveromycinica TaxID=659352 RepID=A0A7U3VLG8_9ACTN|nr:carboxylesterase family protein [Streptomyces sp. SN-593]BBA95487.1 putative para-nitrobenzyl esterase [Streptomyces sp. SN-593]
MTATRRRPPGDPAAPVIATGAGAVRGRTRDGVTRFRRIPYAVAPVGPLRFKAPVAHPGWSGVRDATTPGPVGQHAPDWLDTRVVRGHPLVEDPLYVNVTTPVPERGAGLPVLVWIHGGGLIFGSPNDPDDEPTATAASGVVVVSLSYRLGLEGFMPVGGGDDNRGLRDVLAALEWVAEEIEAFGGDPSRVTIAGVSAGGSLVLALLTLPAAGRLFHAAISMSGAQECLSTAAAAQASTSAFERYTGTEASLDGLRDVSPAELLAWSRTPAVRHQPDRALWIGVHQDGEAVPEDVVEALVAGRGAHVPAVLAFTREENAHRKWVPAASLGPARVAWELGQVGVPAEATARYRALHPGLDDGRLVGRARAETSFHAFALRIADARAARAGGTTWVSQFEWTGPGSGATDGVAAHGADVAHWFGNGAAAGAAPGSVSGRMQGSLRGFLHRRDPGWAPYAPPDRVVRRWDDPVRDEHDPLADLRAFWAGRDITCHWAAPVDTDRVEVRPGGTREPSTGGRP